MNCVVFFIIIKQRYLLSFYSVEFNMQIAVTFPDLELPIISFTVDVNSLVSDVLNAAADEWNIDPCEIDLSFDGRLLISSTKVSSLAIVAGDELVAFKKQFRLFGKKWFTDDTMTDAMLHRYRNNQDEFLYLDAETFSEDGFLSISHELFEGIDAAISFKNCDMITSLDKNFLMNSSIAAIDLSDFNNVATCGVSFLSRCVLVPSLDLSFLNSLVSIGDFFLSKCFSLASLNLSGLSSVTSIGDSFLFQCHSLVLLDLSGLRNLTSVGDNFMCRCSSVVTIDFTGLHNLTMIGSYFLYHCTSIVTLNLTGLCGLKVVGDHFLSRCSSITTLDFSDLISLTSIEGKVLYRCNSVPTITLPETNISILEDKFQR